MFNSNPPRAYEKGGSVKNKLLHFVPHKTPDFFNRTVTQFYQLLQFQYFFYELFFKFLKKHLYA